MCVFSVALALCLALGVPPLPSSSPSVLSPLACVLLAEAAEAQAPAEKPKAAPKKTDSASESREARLLKYAEQRAENAEAELKKFRETHETSVRACTEATQRKQKAVEACEKQAESLRTMYNASQTAKADAEKKLRELEVKHAAATRAEGSSEKLERENASLQQQLKQKEQETAEARSRVRALESEVAKLAAAKASLAAKARDAEAPKSSHIFTIQAMQETLGAIGHLYMAIAEHLVACVPQEMFDKFTTLKLEVATLAAPYVEMVNSKVYQPVAPALAKAQTFFETTLYPIAASGAAKGVRMVASLSDDLLPSVNARVDAALAPIFASHPRVEALVPPSIADRVALLLFLTVVTYFCALFAFRLLLCPVFACVCPCCCKRRHKKGKHSKKFTPAHGASLHASLQKDKKGLPPQESPTRPFAFAGDYKKHKA